MATFAPVVIGLGLQMLSSLFKSTKTKQIELRSPNVNLGSEVHSFFGRVRLEGRIFFPKSTDKMYRVETRKSKGKGFSSTETKTVYGTWATLFSANHCSVTELIINGEHINTSHSFYAAHCTFFDGTQTGAWSEAQLLYPGYEGDIVYKGISYIGFSEVDLTPYGNVIPQDVSAVLLDDRLGETPSLGYVVQTICEDAGIPNSAIDITELIPIELKTGFTLVQSGQGFRDALEQLMQFYQFAAVQDVNNKIKFKLFDRGVATGISIASNYFLPVSDDAGNTTQDGSQDRAYIRTAGDLQKLPNKLQCKFYNQNENFDQDDKVIHFSEATKENIVNIDTTITSYPYEIEERMILLLKMNYLQNRVKFKFRLPILFKDLLPLDLVELPNGETCQLQSVTMGNDFTLDCDAFYYSGQSNYSITPPFEQDPTPDSSLPDPTALPDVYILDTAQFENNPPATLYILASLPATLNFSFNGGDSYPSSVDHLAISTIGDCDTALPNVNGLDITNTLTVTLTSGEIEQITQGEFDTGQNLAMLGVLNGNGFYEGKLIRFRDITLLGGTQYSLSYLYQGDYNTSGYDTSSLPLKFLLLRSPTTSYYSTLVRNVEQISSPLQVLPVVSQWQDLGTTPTTNVTSFNNNSYIAPAVTNVQSEIDGSDNIEISWNDTYGNDSPYRDGTEIIQYQIEIYSDALYTTLVRTEIVNDPSYFYKIADQTTDGVLPLPFYVRIYRINAITGLGNATDATISSPVSNPGLTGIIDADLLQGEDGAYYLDRTNHTGIQGAETVLTSERAEVSTNYTVLATDDKLIIPASGTITITLPNGLATGFEVIIRNIDTSTIDIAVELGGTLEAVGTQIDTQHRVAHFYHSGSNLWRGTGFLV